MMAKKSNVRRGWQILLIGLIISCVIVYVSYMIDAENMNIYGDYIVWNGDLSEAKLETESLKKRLNATRKEMDFMQQLLDKQTKENNEAKYGIKQLQKKIRTNEPKISALQEKFNKAKSTKERIQNILNNKTETIYLMQSEMAQLTKRIAKKPQFKYMRYNLDYMRSYNRWISGIGDHMMSTNPYCPNPLKTETLSNDMVIPPDIYHDSEDKCHSRTFSELFGQTLMIECSMKDKPKIAEFDDLFHSNPLHIQSWKVLKNSTQNQSVFVYRIHKNTQIIWVKCGGVYNMHLSLQSFPTQKEELYQYKTFRIETKFEQKPPNFVIFVIESMSRSMFIRSNPMSVDYLSNLLLHPNSKTNIFQFFRYSTIGYGLKSNLAALIGGTCVEDNCEETAYQNCIGLASFFDKLGYFVPGFDANGNSANNECDFALSSNVFPSDCSANQFGIEYAVQFALDLDEQFKDLQVPYFTILRVKNNGFGMSDKYIRQLMENIDKRNTILHIVSGHGDYGVLNVYGQYEANNPISVLMMPHNLSVNVEKLRTNEQRLINHYDMNLFYKELAVSFLSDGNRQKYEQLIEDNLPKISKDDSFVFSQSILNEIISEDRRCENIHHSYCFCNALQKREITENNQEEMRENLENVINAINDLTENEEWDCQKLDANDFKISLVLKNTMYERFFIEETLQSLRIKRWKRFKAEGKILTYAADIKSNVRNLVKINTFVDVSCRNDKNKPLFVYDPLDKDKSHMQLCGHCLRRNN